MSWTNKVIWHEGMLLRPQHFQQQDRYVEALVRGRVAGLRPYAWGLRDWRIDTGLLENGRFGLAAVSGVLPDGTPVDAPGSTDLPRPLEIPDGTRDSVVHLALPLLQEGVPDSGEGETETLRLAARAVAGVADSAASGAYPAELVLGRPRLRLLLNSPELAGYARLGVARILEIRPDRSVRLDEDYIPPCLNTRASQPIATILEDLRGRFRQLSIALAEQLTHRSPTTVASLGDLLMLQTTNRFGPVLDHMAELADLHPETLYGVLVSAAGDLATVAARDRRPPAFPAYRHEALRESFAPVVAALRQYLAFRGVEGAISIPVEDSGHGMYVAWLEDQSLLATASFVLSVRAEADPEELRVLFRKQARAAPVERLREIYVAHAAGIELRPLQSVPPQIPPLGAQTVYFALDKANPLWREIRNGFGFHVAGRFRGLELRFWAIRGTTP